MLLPLKWLRDYVDIEMGTEEFAEAMTLSGTKTEGIVYPGAEIKNVIVGKVLSIEKHPDADKLVVVRVSIGEEERQIVTGADNLKVGNYVPVALHNAKLPGGKKIKRGSMRGVMSDGMLCSAQELGIDNKFIPEEMREGIYVLSEKAELGSDIHDAMLLDDAIIEFELTANRPDCNCILGIAMEAAATIGAKVELPSLEVKEEGEMLQGDVKIKTELCGRYLLREVKDVKICQSPYYIQRRLIESDVRPINNIVDLTNYVMLEYGQPLHAFDRKKLVGDTIVVAMAGEEECSVTLDGEERTLDPSIITIRDEEKIIALGGIMGAQNSEIDDTTTHIFLESAHFDADTIRASSKKLGLRTDASARFEKGIDLHRCKKALDRLCHLIEKLGYGTVCKGSVDRQTAECKEVKVDFTIEKINEVIGCKISEEEILDILSKLNFKVEKTEDGFAATPPEYRTDVEQFADIVEEVSRIYGFNKIESKPLWGEVIPARKSEERIFEDKIKSAAYKSGLTEVLTYSFVSPSGPEKAGLSEECYKFMRLLNPLGEETSVMRTSLVPNMLDIVSSNMAHKNEFFSGFEFGNIFFKEEEAKQLPSMVTASYGKEEDFFSLKSRLEGIFEILRYESRQYRPNREAALFHPGKCADIFIGTERVGIIGEVHPSVAQAFSLKKKVYLAELDIVKMMSLYAEDIKYKRIPKYPAVKRDIALVVDKGLYVQEIETLIREYGKKLIEKVELFDVYDGDRIEEGKKSVAYSITYRKANATLTDEEVNQVQEKLLSALREKLNAVLRDQ